MRSRLFTLLNHSEQDTPDAADVLGIDPDRLIGGIVGTQHLHVRIFRLVDALQHRPVDGVDDKHLTPGDESVGRDAAQEHSRARREGWGH